MDEKAFQAALAASGVHAGSASWFRTAIEAYEQARERVAVPTNASLREGASAVLAVEPDFMRLPRSARVSCYNALAEWAESLLSAQRPAPSAQPECSVRDLSDKPDREIEVTVRGRVFAVMPELLDVLALISDNGRLVVQASNVANYVAVRQRELDAKFGRTAPSAQPWTLEMAASLYTEHLCLDDGHEPPYYALHRAGLKLFGPTAPVASAQKSGAEWNGCIESQLRTALASVEEEHALRVAVERDLAAERAAHQATKAGLDEAIARGDRLEAKASQLTDMLHAERAAHEATRAEFSRYGVVDSAAVQAALRAAPSRLNALSFNECEQMLVAARVCAADDVQAADEMAACMRNQREIRLECNLASQRADVQRTRAEAAEKRAAELERELAERESDARLHYASWVTAVNTIYATNVALGKPAPDTTDNPVQLATALQAELAACKAKLEALRDACTWDYEGRGEWGYTLAEVIAHVEGKGYSCLTDYLKRIQSALAQESAKPAEHSAVQSRAEFSASAPPAVQRIMVDGYEKAVKPAEPKSGWLGAIIADAERREKQGAPWPSAEVASEPKPGDVLSGEEAKAYMLANPGRRVRRHNDCTHYDLFAKDGVIYTDGRGIVGESVTFQTGEYGGATYTVLPPEPSKPATPDLDLAGRVERLEKFARHVLEAFGKLTTEHGDGVATVFGDTSLADALKALEGGGE